jgi:glycosyltransferase involved in cell wall biosynthesis
MISIGLCSHQGANYLYEQLESITNQNLLPMEVVICDDASSDLTIKIIKNFSKRASCSYRLYQNEKCLGTLQNFSKVISLCKADYIALCDQDDIWLSDKLAITFQAMKEAEEKFGSLLPLLIHTDLAIIDAGGKVIASSFMRLRRLRPRDDEPLPKLLAQNFVTGSTVLINRPLAEAALPIPEEAMMHDWWLALVAAATGKIIYIDRPKVLYRQHETNVIGAGGFFSLESLKRLSDVESREKELAASIKQAIALKDHLKQRTDYQVPAPLLDFLNGVTLGGLKAIKTVKRCGVGKHGLIRNTFYKLLLLKGGYLEYLK